MSRFAYSSYKSEWDQKLLRSFSDAVYVLKLQAQKRPMSTQEIADKRSELDSILEKLANQARSLAPRNAFGLQMPRPSTVGISGSSNNIETSNDADDDIDFTSFASRFIDLNPADVADRLDEIERLRHRLDSSNQSPLNSREFNLLDRLQTLLELEVAQSVQSLYAF